MRSFITLLLALPFPYSTAAAHDSRPRRQNDLAHRARGDLLEKRDYYGRMTFYDIAVGVYARFSVTTSPLNTPSTVLLVKVDFSPETL